MTSNDWQFLKAILAEALERPPHEREPLVVDRCARRPDLLHEARALVASVESADRLLATPAPSSGVVTEADAVDLSVGAQIGPYRVVRKLGSGGMGNVYLASDSRLRRHVAIKVMRPALARTGRLDWQPWREARAAALLNHPNIATIFDIIEHDGRIHIVMEYLVGETLGTVLDRGPLALTSALRIGVAVTAALSHAHQQGILHCDLKPSNIFVCSGGDAVKVLDFGLARSMFVHRPEWRWEPEASEDESLRHAGTPRYMSPEQRGGATLDARSDIYSFGRVFHDMLCASPASRESTGTGSDTHTEVAPSDLSVREVFSRALAEDPDDRFHSAAEFNQELARLLAELTRPKPARSLQMPAITLALFASCSALVGGIPRDPVSGTPVVAHRDVRVTRLTASTTMYPVTGAAMAPEGNLVAYSDTRGLWIRDLPQADARLLPETLGYVPVKWLDGTTILAFGPDGKYVAISSQGGIRSSSAAIALASPDGSQYLEIVVDVEGYYLKLHSDRGAVRLMDMDGVGGGFPQWGTSGGFIVFLRGNGEALALQSLDVVTRRMHTLATVSGRVAFVTTSDGRVLFTGLNVAGAAPVLNGLWQVRVNPGSGAPLGTPEFVAGLPGLEAFELSVSADATKLAVVSASHDGNVYTTTNTRPAELLDRRERLTADGRDDQAYGWTPDSRRVLFVSNRRGSRDIYAQAPDEATPTLLVGGPSDETSPAFTSDGRWLLYVLYEPGSSARLMRVSASGSGPARELLRVKGLSEVQCSTRSFCVVIAGDLGAQSVSRLNPLTGAITDLFHKPFAFFSALAVSPDGRHFAYPHAEVDDQPDTQYFVEVADERGEVIWRSPLPIRTTSAPMEIDWASDGTSVFVATRGMTREPSDVLWHLSPVTGWQRIGPASRALPSPDGQMVALSVSSLVGDVWLVENP
jgi:serine/threonine protein kinase